MCQGTSDVDGRDAHIKPCSAAAKDNPVFGAAAADKELMVFRTFFQNVPENFPVALFAAVVSVPACVFVHGNPSYPSSQSLIACMTALVLMIFKLLLFPIRRLALKSANGQIIMVSQGYSNKNECISAIEKIKKSADSSDVEKM